MTSTPSSVNDTLGGNTVPVCPLLHPKRVTIAVNEVVSADGAVSGPSAHVAVSPARAEGDAPAVIEGLAAFSDPHDPTRKAKVKTTGRRCSRIHRILTEIRRLCWTSTYRHVSYSRKRLRHPRPRPLDCGIVSSTSGAKDLPSTSASVAF
ncbi:MAG TPA: hypothetical protein VGW38_21660 [Chloroflexota bacterium]|nr:hypothetical protein [Chloroflexota bacterium]